MAAFLHQYVMAEPDTLEKARARVDSYTDATFKPMAIAWIAGAADHGTQAFYEDGTQTPNGMTMQAIAERLAREWNINFEPHATSIERTAARMQVEHASSLAQPSSAPLLITEDTP